MCCLFGIVDDSGNLSGRQLSRLTALLATESEARGTDATGIAYNSGGSLRVYKRPLPARRMRFAIPEGTRVVMGHTRLTTQGTEKRNYNNHPFLSRAGGVRFALAHNGVLHNDHTLRHIHQLPRTRIETDSFVAAQLLAQNGRLDFDSLRSMAELVKGSFVFTVLDDRNNLYFVKGDNPLCLYRFPRLGLYLYASTEEILKRAIRRGNLCLECPERVELAEGDILRIDAQGRCTEGKFTPSLSWAVPWHSYTPWTCSACTIQGAELEYMEELKSVAASFGYGPEEIQAMLDHGFTTDEIEEFLYCGEL